MGIFVGLFTAKPSVPPIFTSAHHLNLLFGIWYLLVMFPEFARIDHGQMEEWNG